MNIIKTNYVELKFELNSSPIRFEVGDIVYIMNNGTLTKCQIFEIIDNDEYKDAHGYVMVKTAENPSMHRAIEVYDIADGYRKHIYDDQYIRTGGLVSAQIRSKYYYLDDFDSKRLLSEGDKCYLCCPSVRQDIINRRSMNVMECKIISITKEAIQLESRSLGYCYSINNDNKDKYKLASIDLPLYKGDDNHDE